jgi:hypothetical protein
MHVHAIQIFGGSYSPDPLKQSRCKWKRGESQQGKAALMEAAVKRKKERTERGLV